MHCWRILTVADVMLTYALSQMIIKKNAPVCSATEFKSILSETWTNETNLLDFSRKRMHARCQLAISLITYAHVCSRMLTHAHVCSRMLTYAHISLITRRFRKQMHARYASVSTAISHISHASSSARDGEMVYRLPSHSLLLLFFSSFFFFLSRGRILWLAALWHSKGLQSNGVLIDIRENRWVQDLNRVLIEHYSYPFWHTQNSVHHHRWPDSYTQPPQVFNIFSDRLYRVCFLLLPLKNLGGPI